MEKEELVKETKLYFNIIKDDINVLRKFLDDNFQMTEWLKLMYNRFSKIEMNLRELENL